MDKPLDIEQRAVIKNLMRQGQKCKEIRENLLKVYHDHALSISAIKRWITKFKCGQESLEKHKAGGPSKTATTDEKVAMVKCLVESNRRLTVRDIAEESGISIGRVDFILKKKLGLSKLSARWVPRLLTDEQKRVRAELSLDLFHRFEADPNNFVSRVVTGDETWVYYYDPETKQQSMQWIKKGSRPPVKARVSKSVGKVMLSLFWDCDGPLLVDFMPKKSTIKSQYYCELLAKLRDAILKKRRGKVTKGILLLHDNAPPHKSKLSQDKLIELKFEQLAHPPYSPDLAPSDFHIFPKLKLAMKGQRFSSDDQVKGAVNSWLDSMPKSFWKEGIVKCRDRWLKCHNVSGDYVEK
jgi:histone-lysine N-methyltransferase SETMAR